MKLARDLVCVRISKDEPTYVKAAPYFNGQSVSDKGCVVPTEEGQMIFMDQSQWAAFRDRFVAE